jgi:hypothetical protein
LRIVSIATVVFPVCLSQIINSLCPLPIGTIVSIAFIPVARGTFTDFLVITQGATFSIGNTVVVEIAHFPSIVVPSASTTLHRYSSPTLIEKTLPVDFTS